MSVKPKSIREKKDTNRKELTELRSENKELKRKIARLQKQVQQNQEVPGLDPEPIDSPPIGKSQCKYCASYDIKVFHTPSGKAILLCGSCTKNQNPSKID